MRYLFFLVVIFPFPVMAEEVQLPIRATVVQCGKRAELKASCEKDERCCGLYRQFFPDDKEPKSP